MRWTDLEAWQRLSGIDLDWWEARALIALDAEIRHAMARRAEQMRQAEQHALPPGKKPPGRTAPNKRR